jgi:DNA polymerase III alpha subunit
VTGYHTAYLKAHCPLIAFFTGWMKNAKHKNSGGRPAQQEVFELVNEARLFDIAVEPPDLR